MWRVVFASLFLVIFFCKPGLAATGKSCTEVLMRFSHFVDVPEINPSQEKKEEWVNTQLGFMFGALANSKYKGVPKGENHITVTDSEQMVPDKTRIFYDYEGTILLQKGPRTKDIFPLPRTPTVQGIYEPAVDSRGVNRSTDEHYQDFSDYWYFWDPFKKGSLLKAGVHFDMVNAKIERIKSVKRSYPQYQDLINEEGVIRVSALFGMDDPEHSRDVAKGKDYEAFAFRKFKKELVTLGFNEKKVSSDEKKSIFGNHRFRGFSMEKMVKETKKGNVEVLLFFGPAGIDEPSRPFHYAFKDALEKSSLVIYDGHSGLGSHLDLSAIEQKEGFKIKTDPQKYQILFFNSCSSYSFYNTAFHVLKQEPNPTKYLDVLSNGLATSFDDTQQANLALMQAIDNWLTRGTRQSYQSLSKKMETDNLFIVNGDEDNL